MIHQIFIKPSWSKVLGSSNTIDSHWSHPNQLLFKVTAVVSAILHVCGTSNWVLRLTNLSKFEAPNFLDSSWVLCVFPSLLHVFSAHFSLGPDSESSLSEGSSVSTALGAGGSWRSENLADNIYNRGNYIVWYMIYVCLIYNYDYIIILDNHSHIVITTISQMLRVWNIYQHLPKQWHVDVG